MENGNRSATKPDIAEVRAEIKAMDERLIPQLHGTTRVGTHEDRVTDLERRLISQATVPARPRK